MATKLLQCNFRNFTEFRLSTFVAWMHPKTYVSTTRMPGPAFYRTCNSCRKNMVPDLLNKRWTNTYFLDHTIYFNQVKCLSKASTVQNKIQLMDETGNDMGIVDEREAEAMATGKGLRLVIINENTKPYPTYGFLSEEQLSKEMKTLRQERPSKKQKSEKSLRIGSKITQHDLDIKIKNVITWLDKGHNVRIFIKNVDKNSKAINNVFHSITEASHEKATVQSAKSTEDHILFVIQPMTLSTDGPQKTQKPFTIEQLRKLQKKSAKNS